MPGPYQFIKNSLAWVMGHVYTTASSTIRPSSPSSQVPGPYQLIKNSLAWVMGHVYTTASSTIRRAHPRNFMRSKPQAAVAEPPVEPQQAADKSAMPWGGIGQGQ